jgi:hypothetical protein
MPSYNAADAMPPNPPVYRAARLRADHGHRRPPAAGCPSTASWRMALYEPGLGYYARGRAAVRPLPAVGQRLRHRARAVAAVRPGAGGAGGAGAGGHRAHEVLGVRRRLRRAGRAVARAGRRVRATASSTSRARLRQRQASGWRALATACSWLDALPDTLHGVVVGNEVLDAMPVQLLHWDGAPGERGVGLAPTAAGLGRPPHAAAPAGARRLRAGHRDRDPPQAEAFVRTLAERLHARRGLLHRLRLSRARVLPPAAHRRHADVPPRPPADTDPLADVGDKDITAHVNFSAVALAAQDAGLQVLGYTSQARFLLNCGLPRCCRRPTCATRADAQKLITEHEMGELFKVIGLAAGHRLRRHRLCRRRPQPHGCRPHALAARLPARLPGVQRPAGLAAQDRPGQAAGRLQLSPARARLVRAAGQQPGAEPAGLACCWAWPGGPGAAPTTRPFSSAAATAPGRWWPLAWWAPRCRA